MKFAWVMRANALHGARNGCQTCLERPEQTVSKMNGTDKDPRDSDNPEDAASPGADPHDNVTPLEAEGRQHGGESEVPDRLSPEAEADTRTYEELFDENSALKDKLLRAMAEAQNMRRRAQREKDDAAKYAISTFARELLEVQDNLVRALESVSPQDMAAGGDHLVTMFDGVEMTQRMLQAAFERHKIEILDPVGEKFDPNFHQAVAEIPGTPHAGGTVVDVMQTGYLIGDRLLRPAMVTIAKGEATGSDEGEPGGTVDTNA